MAKTARRSLANVAGGAHVLRTECLMVRLSAFGRVRAHFEACREQLVGKVRSGRSYYCCRLRLVVSTKRN